METVGAAFLAHYYSTFDRNRADLAPLYQANSMMTFEGAQCLGQQQIVTKLLVQLLAHKQEADLHDLRSFNGDCFGRRACRFNWCNTKSSRQTSNQDRHPTRSSALSQDSLWCVVAFGALGRRACWADAVCRYRSIRMSTSHITSARCSICCPPRTTAISCTTTFSDGCRSFETTGSTPSPHEI